MARKKLKGETKKVSLREGRPPSFENVDDLYTRAEAYFGECETLEEIPNKAGLALFLGCSRETLSVYGKDKGMEFSDAVARIYAFVENKWVQRLTRVSPTGVIFYLKNAFAYSDSFDHTSGGKPLQYLTPGEIAGKHKLVLDIKKEPEPIKMESAVVV